MLPLQLKLKAVLILVLGGISALGVTGYLSYDWGYSNASTLHELRYEKRETDLREQVTKAQQSVLDAERDHTAAIARVRTAYEQQAQDAAMANAAVIADLRSSQRRVRVPVTDCRNAAMPAPEPATRADHEPRTAELDPAVAARIWAIAADGDRAVQKLTALQNWAREAVRLCNNHQPGRQ